MNRNVSEAARGSQSIAAAITGLAAGTQATNDGVAEAQRAAADLARMSGELQEAVPGSGSPDSSPERLS